MRFLNFKRVSFLILTILAAVTLIFNPNYKNNDKKTEDIYILKSYKNSVALYKNDEVLEVFSDVVLNTLPTSDIIMLQKGIVIENLSQVGSILEDYDG